MIIKKVISIFFLFILLVSIIPIMPEVQAQSKTNNKTGGNPTLPNYWEFPTVNFTSTGVNFTQYNQTMFFEFPFIVSHKIINESCHKYDYSVTGLSVSFIFKQKDDLSWKLTINGTTSANRYYNINLNALNGIQSGNVIIFNNIFIFNWTDSPSSITINSLISSKAIPRIFLPKGNFSIDPSFGYISLGGSASAVDGIISGSSFTFVGGTGYQADSITVGLLYTIADSAWNVTCAIYNNSTLALVGQTQTIVQHYTASATWYTFNFVSKPALTNNTAYLLVVWADNPTGTLRMAVTSSDFNKQFDSKTATYTAIYPNPLVSPTLSNSKASIFCNYSTVSSGTNYTVSVTSNMKFTTEKITQTDYIRNIIGNINITSEKTTQVDYIRNYLENLNETINIIMQTDYNRSLAYDITISVIKITQTDYIRTLINDLSISVNNTYVSLVYYVYLTVTNPIYGFVNLTGYPNLVAGYIYSLINGSTVTLTTYPIPNATFLEYIYNGTPFYQNPIDVTLYANGTIYSFCTVSSSLPINTTINETNINQVNTGLMDIWLFIFLNALIWAIIGIGIFKWWLLVPIASFVGICFSLLIGGYTITTGSQIVNVTLDPYIRLLIISLYIIPAVASTFIVSRNPKGSK